MSSVILFYFLTNNGRSLSKFTCRDLVNCFLQFKSMKPGFPCQDTRRLAPLKTTNHLGTTLIGMWFWQINASLPCSRQPVTRLQYVHRISGAVRLGWPDRIHRNLTASQVRQPSRGCFTHRFCFFIFPEHYSLWAWGCHSQKATTRSPTIPAAWAKRKRTGRLKKVRLVLRWNKAITITIIIVLNGRQQEFDRPRMTDTLHAFLSLLGQFSPHWR